MRRARVMPALTAPAAKAVLPLLGFPAVVRESNGVSHAGEGIEQNGVVPLFRRNIAVCPQTDRDWSSPVYGMLAVKEANKFWLPWKICMDLLQPIKPKPTNL